MSQSGAPVSPASGDELLRDQNKEQFLISVRLFFKSFGNPPFSSHRVVVKSDFYTFMTGATQTDGGQCCPVNRKSAVIIDLWHSQQARVRAILSKMASVDLSFGRALPPRRQIRDQPFRLRRGRPATINLAKKRVLFFFRTVIHDAVVRLSRSPCSRPQNKTERTRAT